MLDLEQLRGDLLDLRLGKSWSQRELGERANIDYGKIQRFESGKQSGLSIQDVAAWLDACDTDMAIYFGQVEMLKDLEVLKEDEAIAETFKRAMKIPAKRNVLKLYLDGLFADEKWSERNQKVPRGRQSSPSAGRGEK